MSGSAGGNRIPRSAVEKTVNEYIAKVLSKFPNFKSAKISGSYNTGTKQDFGDIDLIVHLQAEDKKGIKVDLAKYLSSLPDDVVVPFKSEKYKDKKYLNTGEIITILYPITDMPGEFVQIDNIISISGEEAEFKKQFLDYPAEIQGLMLGLAKVMCLEENPKTLFTRLGIKNIPSLESNQEYEFNLSSAGLTLRIVTLDNFKETDRTDVWKSSNWSIIKKLFEGFNIDGTFEELLNNISSKIKNIRSKNRIKGIFSSMVSIKSGEVNTPKGDNKQKALDKVSTTLTENNIGGYLAALLLEEDKPTIAIFPGAFKPPHKGHFEVVKKLLQHANEVVILISPKTRDGITADESVAIWELYKNKLEGKIEVRISEITPIKETYDVVKDNPDTDFLVAFGKGEIDRYKTMDQYPNVKIFDAGNFEGLNATSLRMAIVNNDTNAIQSFLPNGITIEQFLSALGRSNMISTTKKEEPLDESSEDSERSPYQDAVLASMSKIEQTSQTFNMPISDIQYAFETGNEMVLSDNMWEKLQNSKSYKMKTLDDAIRHALKLGINPKPYIDYIKQGKDLPLPLVLNYGDGTSNFWLVGGEVILSLYRALGSIPTVLQGNLNLKIHGTITPPITEDFYSKSIQESIEFDIKEYGMIPEYKVDLNDTYPYSEENGFYIFNDSINKTDVVVKLKQINDITEFKFYPIKDGKILGFNKLEKINPKVMNTVFKIFLDEILPNHNNILIQPSDYTRYRLFRALINNNLSKNQYNIKTVDEPTGTSYIEIQKRKSSPLSEIKKTKLNEEQNNTIRNFLKFAIKELELKTVPKLTISHDTEKAKTMHTFGYFDPNNNSIWLYFGHRVMADVLRTLAHELVHRKQDEEGRINQSSGETGSDIENEANAQAGVLLRNFGKIHTEIYEIKN